LRLKAQLKLWHADGRVFLCFIALTAPYSRERTAPDENPRIASRAALINLT